MILIIFSLVIFILTFVIMATLDYRQYKNQLKITRLGVKSSNKWTTFCDFCQEKQHQEQDFIGVVEKVYKPNEQKWVDLGFSD